MSWADHPEDVRPAPSKATVLDECMGQVIRVKAEPARAYTLEGSFCTKEERAFLDAVAADPHGDVHELQMKLAISRVPQSLVKRAIRAHAASIMAHREREAVWEQFHALGLSGRSKAFREFYDMLETEAQKQISEVREGSAAAE